MGHVAAHAVLLGRRYLLSPHVVHVDPSEEHVTQLAMLWEHGLHVDDPVSA